MSPHREKPRIRLPGSFCHRVQNVNPFNRRGEWAGEKHILLLDCTVVYTIMVKKNVSMISIEFFE